VACLVFSEVFSYKAFFAEKKKKKKKKKKEEGDKRAFCLVILFDSDCVRIHLATRRRNAYRERERGEISE
jgi:hypothetical protein